MITARFNYKPMTRDSVNGRRVYLTPDGEKLPSVTTILDATKPPESVKALAEWKKRVGKQQAQQISTEASSRGTRMHKWLETYIKTDNIGTPGTNPYSQQSHTMAQSIITQGLAHVNEFWGVEVPIYYSGLYAGTTDCVGVWKQKPAIIDFKQTNKLKKKEWIGDYFLQLAAYSQAHDNMNGTDIKTGVILMCSSNNVFQEFVIEGTEFDFWVNKWYDRLEQYYAKN